MSRVYLWRVTVIVETKAGFSHTFEFTGPAPRGGGQWDKWWNELNQKVWHTCARFGRGEAESFGVYLEQDLAPPDKAKWHEWRREQIDGANGKEHALLLVTADGERMVP